MTDALATVQVRNGIALRCLPDHGVARVGMTADGSLRLRIPGQMEVSGLGDPGLKRAYTEMWHAPGTALTLPPQIDAVANLITSIEDCAQSLAELDAALPAGLPVLNHPRAVALTRRTMAAAVFGPIPGLAVPLMRSLVADTPDAFQRAFAAGGFSFPVLVEPVLDDGNNTPHLIAGPGDWQKIFSRPWGNRPFIMVQSNERLVPWRAMLGKAGNFWHAEVFRATDSALPVPPPPPADEVRNHLRNLIAGVGQRLPLDCWTLEVALAEDRLQFERLVVGPPVVVATERPTPRHAAITKLRERMDRPLLDLLAQPGLWRADAARVPVMAQTVVPHPTAKDRRLH